MLEELPDWVDVLDSTSVDGFDTVVALSDEVHTFCDPYDDGLDQALADQPGVDAVLVEDRDLIYLRTSMALADVKAVVIRAIVDVNRSPRRPAPSDALSHEEVAGLLPAVLPLLQGAGFVNEAASRYFYRDGGDGFVQCIAVAPGIGTSGDGTVYYGLVWVMAGTHIPEDDWDRPSSPDEVVPAHCGHLVSRWTPPNADALRRTLAGEVLPDLDSTRDRAGLAAWVSADPTRVAVPLRLPTYARLFAEWGLVAQAEGVVAHLDAHWPFLLGHPDALAAQELIRAARGRTTLNR